MSSKAGRRDRKSYQISSKRKEEDAKELGKVKRGAGAKKEDAKKNVKAEMQDELFELKKADAVNFREITFVEEKRLQRIKKEDGIIYKVHSLLQKQEQVLCHYAERAIGKSLQPPFLLVELLKFQLEGVSWMVERESSSTNGGILADEMGMGKTIQMIGLILSGNIGELTLVVVPAVALNQWISEIQRCTRKINIIVNYGRKKIINYQALLKDDHFNVFLTTYSTIENNFRSMNSALHGIHFYRVVLDEAHTIKDSRSSTSSAISRLSSEKRWGMTGTPVQNRISDLYSLVRFLKLDPHSYYFCKKCDCKSLYWLNYHLKTKWESRGFCTCGHFGASHFSWWNRKISNMIKDFGYTVYGRKVFSDLDKITSHIILRRTKDTTELFLPPKTVRILKNYFSKEEKDFYTSIYSNTKKRFMKYAARGEVSHNYAHIFELLQKMRLAANHPYLVNKQDGPPVCGFCNEEADDPVISKCRHVFCREEARIFLADQSTCPVCKVKITLDLNQNHDFSYTPNWTGNWISSTKIECLIEKLTQSPEKGLVKSIVFSQFVGFLDMLRWRLERAGFRTVCVYGSMPLEQRKVAINSFNTDSRITVFLISLKAGGVALNLTEASQVFIMDLWWNPAVEEQAMDRIHRIGQYRPINIFKIIIEDSIDSKVLALQNKKKALFDSAVDNDLTALERLSEEDLMFLFS